MSAVWRAIFLFALVLAMLDNTYASEQDEESGVAATDDEAQDLMEHLDKNGDGKVSLEEVVELVAPSEEEEGEDAEQDEEEKAALAEMKGKMEKHFKISDADGDSFLDVRELKTMIDLFTEDEEL
mmetsp:Transcript_5020/g.12251  ORF Transcript_5020/g.12251 Transcript_5020/m.12251 type:complete len:125 (-) Transcript_5020:95-469(-)